MDIASLQASSLHRVVRGEAFTRTCVVRCSGPECRFRFSGSPAVRWLGLTPPLKQLTAPLRGAGTWDDGDRESMRLKVALSRLLLQMVLYFDTSVRLSHRPQSRFDASFHWSTL